jgi:hypothetical protein
MISRKDFANSIGRNINELEKVLTQLNALKRAIEDKKTDRAEYVLVAGQAFLDEGRKTKEVSDKLFGLSDEVDKIA